MDTKKSILASLAILFLLLGCLVAGKFLFLPDTEVEAQAMATGKYQVSCAHNPTGNGSATCVIIDTRNGMVVNIIKPNVSRWCGMTGDKSAGMVCNDGFKKPLGKKNKQPAANQGKKAVDSTGNKTKKNP